MESSRQDLSNDVAEHMPILKNNQNTYHTRCGTYFGPVSVLFWFHIQKKHSVVQEV